jgi:hypothetical protein
MGAAIASLGTALLMRATHQGMRIASDARAPPGA